MPLPRSTVLLSSFLFAVVAQGANLAPRSESLFDAAWRFSRGDIAGAEQREFDDGGWMTVDTPHDWSITGPYDEHAPSGGAGAFLPTGISWYRKRFNIPVRASGRHVFVHFDGVMHNSGVWINGVHLGHRPYGYSGFRYELTPHLRYGEGIENSNVICVRSDTEAQPASRWYAGSGIYRHVRLITTGDIHVDTWGTFVTTPIVTPSAATVHVDSSVRNHLKNDESARLEVAIVDPRGRTAARSGGAMTTLHAGEATTLTAEVTLRMPHLWDISDPSLYRGIVRVLAENGAVLDEEEVSFGVRESRFDATTGFWLNGRNIKLKGVALHADAGAFGMAAPLAFWERRLRALQALGVNAIRTAHHPFNPEVLDLCDRLGLLVMDEAFDTWTVGKNPNDYHLYFNDWSSTDVRDFVRRDRNHPSVVIWSAGNEIHDTTYPLIAKAILTRLLKVFHENDPTRPVTMALLRPNTTGDYQNGLADLLDVVGQNYRERELEAAHAQRPSRKIVGTENSKSRESWLVVRDNPAYAGMFLWTGADYLGEAETWPANGMPFGLLDRIGRIRPIGLERASWWSPKPVVHLARRVIERVDTAKMPTTTAVALPAPAGPELFADWTPRNTNPHEELVEAYSNCEVVELFLNEHSLGRKMRNADDSPRTWKVAFVPGSLRAAAYDSGRLAAEESLRTALAPARLAMASEQPALSPGFDAIGFVRIEIVDANGTLVPDAQNTISIGVEGAASLAAFDNGDLNDVTPFRSPQRRALGGQALLMLRAQAQTGVVTVRASSPGLQPISLQLPIR